MLSTQMFARMMNYDPHVMGPPLILRPDGRAFYNPLLFLLCYAKYSLKPEYHPYLQAALPPFVASCIIAAVLILVIAIARGIKRSSNLHGTARWATLRDLRRNGLVQDNGVVLGQLHNAVIAADKSSTDLVLHHKHGAKLVCHSGKMNTLLLAPTGSGKGVSVIIPTLLSYSGSMVVFDPKGENYNITAGWRRQFSHVIRFAPLSHDTIRFNPVAAIRGGDSAFADANMIADMLFQSNTTQSSGNEEFFNNSAKDLVTTALLHIRFSDWPQKNFRGLLKILRDVSPAGGEDEGAMGKELWHKMIDTEHYYISENGERVVDYQIHEIIAEGARSQLAKNPREQASVFSTAFAKLQLFADPLIAYSTGESDFDLTDFIHADAPITLYLVVPYAHIDRIAPVFRLLITFILKQFADGETQHGAVKLKNHLLFLLDEFPVLGAFSYIEQVMGVLRGYGINFLIVCQALAQLKKIYGHDHIFLDHCVCKAVFAPGKAQDAEDFVKEIGKETVREDKVSRSGNRFAVSMQNLNYSDSELGVNLIEPDQLMRLPSSESLVTSHGMYPYIAKKVVYYEDERFKWKTEYRAPATLAEMRYEIKQLPSNKRGGMYEKIVTKDGFIEMEACADVLDDGEIDNILACAVNAKEGATSRDDSDE